MRSGLSVCLRLRPTLVHIHAGQTGHLQSTSGRLCKRVELPLLVDVAVVECLKVSFHVGNKSQSWHLLVILTAYTVLLLLMLGLQ